MWIVALGLGFGLGALIGAFQGFLIAYIGVPSFVVTLGGLLAFRGVVWVLSSGAAVTGIDDTFRQIGGGALGSLGGDATWLLAVVGCVAIVGLLAYNRRQRRRFGFRLRPLWAEVLIGVVGCVVVLGLAAFANQNYLPKGLAANWAEERDIVVPPEGLQVPMGISWPIIVVIAVTLLMTFLATRRRFGRYVYAYGGNPDAADLAGINTRWTIMKTFVVMGVLCAIAAAIVVGRLDGAAQDLGSADELYVIAAAVVGGTSFAGGVGTIPGAVLGAFVMAALSYGLAFMGVNSPMQSIVAGHRPGRRRGLRHVQPPARRRPAGGTMMADDAQRSPLVEMRNISVAFGGVHAVDDVSIDLHEGEVVGLVGGNGAGKSTLMRVLSGAHPADSGEILIDGQAHDRSATPVTPRTSRSRPSTRRWRWPTTSAPRATSSWAAS